MKKVSKLKRFAVTLAFASVFLCGVKMVDAETIKKLHSSIQIITTSTQFNDANEPTSNTLDLSGGDLDKCSFAVTASSAAGNATLSLAVQISPDGGTTWVATGDTIAVATSTALGNAVSAHSEDIHVSPGLKLRVVPTLAQGATYYNFKLYALPSVD